MFTEHAALSQECCTGQEYFPETSNYVVCVLGSTPPSRTEPKHGFWEYYSYGMACMYKSDYSTMDQYL